MTIPYIDPDSIHNPTIGAPIPPEWGDTVNDGMNFLAYRPGCLVKRTANQSIPNTTSTAVAWTATDVRDTDDYHDPAFNPSRIAIPTGLGGLYQIGCAFAWATTATASSARTVRIRVNGSTYIGSADVPGVNNASYATSSNIHMLYPLNAGDYVEFMAYQTVGSAQNIIAASLPCVGWVQLETVL